MNRLVRSAAIAAATAAALGLAAAAHAQTKIAMIGFGGASNLPVWLAIDNGLFKKQGLDVSLAVTRGSEAQFKDLMGGKYQLASTAIDNVIAYAEGQGPVQYNDYDVVAFMGVHSGLNSVVGGKDVKTFADFKGKTLCVDAMATGYAFVLFDVLEKHGLVMNRDYKVIAVGGGYAREKSLIEGKASGAVLSAPSDLSVQAKGGHIIADAAAELGGYQGSSYAARRGWIKGHEKEVEGFIKAIVAAHDVIFTQKPAAIAVLKKRIKNLSDENAAIIYTSLTTGAGGLNRHAEIKDAGVATVLKLRSRYAEPKKTLTDTHKYYDMSFYEKATGMK